MSADVLGHLITAIAALIAAWLSLRTKKAVQEVHIALNSRLSELLEVTRKQAHAEGVVAGQKKEGE